MIKLDANDSLMMLLAKGWKYKECLIPRDAKGRYIRCKSKLEYIQLCMNVWCYGKQHSSCGDADVYGIYRRIFEKVLSPKAFLDAYEDSVNPCRKITFLQGLISQLSITSVKDKIELDMSLVDIKESWFK